MLPLFNMDTCLLEKRNKEKFGEIRSWRGGRGGEGGGKVGSGNSPAVLVFYTLHPKCCKTLLKLQRKQLGFSSD